MKKLLIGVSALMALNGAVADEVESPGIVAQASDAVTEAPAAPAVQKAVPASEGESPATIESASGTSVEEAAPEKAYVAEKNAQTMIDEYLAAKGWSGGMNQKDGRTFFIATATSNVAAPAGDRNYINSRMNAFTKAMLFAKKDMVEFLGAAIESGAIPFAEEDDPIDARISKMIGKRKEAPESIDRFRRRIRTAAAAEVVGLQAICTFEGVSEEGMAEIGVVAVWSPKLKQMAHAIKTGANVAKLGAKTPIINQISADEKALLSTFGVQQKIDEHGDLVLVAFGQAGGKGTPRVAAENIAKANSEAMIREFAGEAMLVTTDTMLAETVEDFEKAEEKYGDVTAFKMQIAATAESMNITGISVVKKWRTKHPVTGDMVYGCVCAWSPKQRKLAEQITGSESVSDGAQKENPAKDASIRGGGISGDDNAF